MIGRKYNKYNVKKTIVDGNVFDSQKEAERYIYLRELEKVGRISELRLQVEYVLFPARKKKDGKTERKCSYIADFVYRDTVTGETVVEDVKGYRGGQAYALFTVKRKAMLAIHSIEVREV